MRAKSIRFSRRLASALGALALASAPAAHAQLVVPQLVFDPRALMEQGKTIQQRVEMISMQRRQLQHQIDALRKLPDPNWRQIGTLMYQLDAVMREGDALAYSLANIDAEFRRTFPGYRVPNDYPAESRDQVTRTLATLRAALNVASMQARDVGYGQETLARIKARMGTADGHQQAIELQSTLIGFTADELSSLRQAVATQTNAQAVYQAYLLQQQAQAHAIFDDMIQRARNRPPSGAATIDTQWRRQP
jgi:P-type conjugative transfer protein TrbJ